MSARIVRSLRVVIGSSAAGNPFPKSFPSVSFDAIGVRLLELGDGIEIGSVDVVATLVVEVKRKPDHALEATGEVSARHRLRTARHECLRRNRRRRRRKVDVEHGERKEGREGKQIGGVATRVTE